MRKIAVAINIHEYFFPVIVISRKAKKAAENWSTAEIANIEMIAIFVSNPIIYDL